MNDVCDNSNINDTFFKELALNRGKIESSWTYIVSAIEKALSIEDVEGILAIKKYIESQEGSYAYNTIGECSRVYRICCIVEIENNNNLTLFCDGCHTYEELMTKYMLTLYSIRRLNFQLSDTSQEEAILFLRSNGISGVAAWIIINNDLVVPYDDLLTRIQLCFSDIWSGIEMQLYEQLKGK